MVASLIGDQPDSSHWRLIGAYIPLRQGSAQITALVRPPCRYPCSTQHTLSTSDIAGHDAPQGAPWTRMIGSTHYPANYVSAGLAEKIFCTQFDLVLTRPRQNFFRITVGDNPAPASVRLVFWVHPSINQRMIAPRDLLSLLDAAPNDRRLPIRPCCWRIVIPHAPKLLNDRARWIKVYWFCAHGRILARRTMSRQ